MAASPYSPDHVPMASTPESSKVPGSGDERFAVFLKCHGYNRQERGFTEELRSTVPQQLADAGVEQEVWSRFMSEYDRLVVPKSDVAWKHMMLVVAWSFVCPGIVLSCCMKERNFSPLQKGAAEWLELVNAELEPRGMFARFQTHPSPPEKGGREWLPPKNIFSVALTSKESAILRDEDFYVNCEPTGCDRRMESENVI
eukprot:m.30648 g.30648  ORF g.30648 m.30648 type:complete len:199 (-) comp9501_c0_seq1:169-765(-)